MLSLLVQNQIWWLYPKLGCLIKNHKQKCQHLLLVVAETASWVSQARYIINPSCDLCQQTKTYTVTNDLSHCVSLIGTAPGRLMKSWNGYQKCATTWPWWHCLTQRDIWFVDVWWEPVVSNEKSHLLSMTEMHLKRWTNWAVTSMPMPRAWMRRGRARDGGVA